MNTDVWIYFFIGCWAAVVVLVRFAPLSDVRKNDLDGLRTWDDASLRLGGFREAYKTSVRPPDPPAMGRGGGKRGKED